MTDITPKQTRNKLFWSKSRVPGNFKKPTGFEDWFYTGPTKHFGHPNANKRKGKKG
jgi:hypothetical protein